MKKTRHWLCAAAPLAAAFFSLLMLADAVRVPVKAELAQRLIAMSWQRSDGINPPAPPWPWADTYPAGVLRVPSQGVQQFVLEGGSGRNLAFGPVFRDGTRPGRDVVISGHRDTHFRFLEALRAGDLIGLETRQSTRWFRVSEMEVVDSRSLELLIEPGLDRLSLVTCYPFDSLASGGPLRYVVTAQPVRRRSLSSG